MARELSSPPAVTALVLIGVLAAFTVPGAVVYATVKHWYPELQEDGGLTQTIMRVLKAVLPTTSKSVLPTSSGLLVGFSLYVVILAYPGAATQIVSFFAGTIVTQVVHALL